MAEETKKEVAPDYPDEETKKIVEEAAAEKAAKEAEKAQKEGEGEKPKPKEPEGKKAEEGQKDAEPEDDEEDAGDKGEEDEGDDDGEKPKEKPKRTPKLMPIFKHKIAEKNWANEKQTLLDKIAEFESKPSAKMDEKKGAAIKAFAEKHGFEPDAISELIDLIGGPRLEKNLEEKLNKLEQERKQSSQDTQFRNDYSKNVVPILERDEIPKEKWNKVEKIIKDLAFTDKYVGNDLDEIYIIAKNKGMLENLGIVKGKKSAEGSRGGARGGEVDKSKPASDSDEDFLKWSDEMAKGQSDKTYHSIDDK